MEICRAERISDSLLGQADGCGERGRGVGENSTMVQKMTSVRRGVNERGGRDRMGWWW